MPVDQDGEILIGKAGAHKLTAHGQRHIGIDKHTVVIAEADEKLLGVAEIANMGNADSGQTVEGDHSAAEDHIKSVRQVKSVRTFFRRFRWRRGRFIGVFGWRPRRGQRGFRKTPLFELV